MTEVKRKRGGKLFVKGVSGNPKGRPKLDPDLKAIENLTKDELRKIVSRLSRMSEPEVIELMQNTATPILERSVAATLLKSVEFGDPIRLDRLLDRAIGKVSDEIKLQVARPVIIERIGGGETVLTHEIVKTEEAE